MAIRAGGLTGMVMVLFLALLARFYDLMVTRHAEFRAAARGQTSTSRQTMAFRGALRDRHGRNLALTRAWPSVAVDPSAIVPEDREAVAERLSATLGIPRRTVLEQLAKDSRFRWLSRQITDPRVLARLPALACGGVEVREELARSHPAGRVGAQLVGFTDVDGQGLSGLELVLDTVLAPRFGRQALLRDGKAGLMRPPVDEASPEPGRDGADVVLAMDLTIQTFVEEALDRVVAAWRPVSAVAVVLDPRNGDILALASRPTFDPGARRNVPAEATRIRAVTDSFEVGSTMKPLIAAAALDAGLVGVAETIDCTEDGSYKVGKRTLHDHHPLGRLSFPEVIVKSSNIGMAQIGQRLGIDRTYRLFRALGFGRTTGSGLPGEVPGKVTERARWTEAYTLASVSMGHEIAVTPLQFASAFSALVADGIIHRPRAILRIGDREIPPAPLRQVYGKDVTRNVMAPILARVVTEGTGTKAMVPGHVVGGKTGTAQVLSRGGVAGYVASFIGVAPMDEPRFTVFVLLDRPRRDQGTPYGGTCAAPCVGEILARCLGYAEIAPSRSTGDGRPEARARHAKGR
jgi:cell division protein FtsI (penicillin-binding protein 3)